MIELGVRILLSTGEYMAGMMLALSLFRVSLQDFSRIRTLAIVGAAMATITHTLRDHPELADTYLVSTLCGQIVLLTVLFRYSFIYSNLVAAFCFLSGALIEMLVYYLLSGIGLASPDMLETSLFQVGLNIGLTTIVLLFLTWVVVKKKLGFLYAHDPRKGLRAYQYWVCMLFAGGAVVLQWFAATANLAVLQAVPMLMLFGLLIVSLVLAYFNNKKIMTRGTAARRATDTRTRVPAPARRRLHDSLK